jgi:hypothetical protein
LKDSKSTSSANGVEYVLMTWQQTEHLHSIPTARAGLATSSLLLHPLIRSVDAMPHAPGPQVKAVIQYCACTPSLV